MKDESFPQTSVSNSDPVSSQDLAAQADALLSSEEAPAQAGESFAPEAQPIPEASTAEPPAQNGHPQAPQGYELRYIATAQGYQPVYMPIQAEQYPPVYPQSPQAPYPQSPQGAYQAPHPQAPGGKGRKASAQRPGNALKRRPRKKPWGKILVACLIAAAIIAVLVWAVVAGASALIRSLGGENKSGYPENNGFYGNWDGSGEIDENMFGGSMIIDGDGNLIGGWDSSSFRIDEDGNLIDSDGNIISNIIITTIPSGNSSAYISVDPENALMFARGKNGVKLYDQPEGKKLATIPNGYPVYALGFQGSWAEIQYQDTLGWVDCNSLSYEPAAEPQIYYVHADGGLNMRAEPTTASARIENIPNATQIYCLCHHGDWVFTFYGGTYGWVNDDYLGSSPPKATQPSQDAPSTGGYSRADVESAISQAKAYYRSRKGKAPSGGLTGSSLTDSQVEALYWQAVGLVNGMEFFPAGQFENIGGVLETAEPCGFFYQVSDPKIQTMEDWADRFYSVLSDDLACNTLCYAPMFMLDGNMYISGGAMGDEGLYTEYTVRVEEEPGGYKLIMDVVNIRYNDNGVNDRYEWQHVAHCFKEDGVWVFDSAVTPYR